jgi:CzcA family heavy metal efflux pump
MLSWLVSTSLRFRVLVLAAACVLIAWGFRAVRETPLDVFPEFALPTVEVQTEAPGLSCEEVESLVTTPLENALNGLPWLDTIRSKTVLGLSQVVCLFEERTDLMLARQLVQERLAALGPRLPVVARAPAILPPLSSTSRVLKIGMWSDTLSQLDLTDLALWTVRPQLMGVRGVANVAIWGQRDRQFQVLVDPDRLRAHALTLGDVERAARDAASLETGGLIDTPAQRLPVTHVPTLLAASDLGAAVVAFRDGAPLRLRDVAEVVEGFPPPIGDAVINIGKQGGAERAVGAGLLLVVEKQPWGNTLDVTREVEKALEAMRPGLAGVELDSTIFRPATFIERALRNLGGAMALAAALVVVVLLAFLFEWRTAVISIVAIPLSLLAVALVLRLLGGSVNTMVLAGLVIAVGEVVDDAIIDVENISRRLRLNRESGEPRSVFAVVLAASLEVRSAVVYATWIVVLVFLPVFFLDGLAGSFFRPLALAYVLAIVASLIVALTVTPAMSFVLLGNVRGRRRDAPLVRALRRGFRAVLPWFARRPRAIVIFLAAAFTASGLAVTRFGEEFLPEFHETDFLMHWVGKPGTSVEAMRRITERVSGELRAIPGVRNFGAHIGRAEVADEIYGPNFCELWISIEEDADYEGTVARIQEVVDGYPGLIRDVLTYLSERIEEVLTGASAAIVVRVFGPELDVLRSKAVEVHEAIRKIPGVVEAQVEPQQLVPRVEVRLRPEDEARFGLTASDVRRAAATLVKGTTVGEVYHGQRLTRVAVWGVPTARASLASLRALPMDTPSGAQVPLGGVADVWIAPTPNTIRRENASRRIDVTCNVRGRDLGSTAREIEASVRALPFDRGYHPEVIGTHAAREEASERLLVLSSLAVAGILVLLWTDFQSLRLTALVALSLPFALIGGVGGAFAGGGDLSLGSLIGFVTVLGIAARNGILLVSHYRHLEEEEGVPFGLELALRGAEERLAPILMTALTAALALLPLALGGERPGHEIEYPMSLVILGGLVTSTALNLFLMPALYLAFGKGRASQRGRCPQPKESGAGPR